MRNFIQPPEIVEVNQPVVFLAGPVQGADDWQSEAASKIHALNPEVIIASPRFDYPDGTFVYEKQVDWETHFLNKAGRAGVIAFWLAAQSYETPGRSYAQTTRFELGYWLGRHSSEHNKMIIGVEDEETFGNIRYFRHRYAEEAPTVPVVNTLDELALGVVELLK